MRKQLARFMFAEKHPFCWLKTRNETEMTGILGDQYFSIDEKRSTKDNLADNLYPTFVTTQSFYSNHHISNLN